MNDSKLHSPVRAAVSQLYQLLTLSTVVAVLALWGHQLLPEKTLPLVPYYVHESYVFHDGQNGGNTQGNWQSQQDLSFVCEVVNPDQSSYCGASIKVKPPEAAVDYSAYRTATFYLSYTGPNERLRVKLHAYVPPSEQHYANEVLTGLDYVFSKQGELADVTIPASAWHLSDMNLFDLQNTTPQLDVVFDVAPPLLAGQHTLRVDQIVLQGEWLPVSFWYAIVGVGWLVFNVIFLGRLLKVQQARLANDANRLSQLTHFSSHLKEESEHYKTLSSHDPLTGALNRSGFALEFRHLFPDSRLKLNTALLVIDLDHFKRVNDTYGHDAGDKVLQQCAETLFKNVRLNDRLVRWGGEEFALLCVDTSLQQAQLIAEKIRTMLEELDIQTGKATLSVTASIGVAVSNHLEEFDALFQRADKALYHAKEIGRNCVVLAD
ncbi:GGDEF domain-containing protein [Alteromonas sp. AMM-1]|uniref:GGDEF domain-containing protein n=1 Tax=Alteromonas sp. AMM-1 TaxID=3394233 RepID=UPI0039A538CB